MTVGIVMLVHTAFDRAEQVARYWAAGGCPVVVHVDSNVSVKVYQAFQQALSDVPGLKFSRRHRCEWGSWGLVAASQDAAGLMLRQYPQVSHVYLSSGSCLPLRPVKELQDYLADRPETDFIESATTADVPWTVGGLDQERFTLRFPFSWRRQRKLFDAYVALQRRLRVKRRIPKGLVPHMGSQWWCLTRRTLEAILTDPDRSVHDRYFKRVWIPDESYFQTLVRHVSHTIESRSLTLSKFDFQGKPHTFYDDHLQLLRRSDCFVARKIWPHADRLYETFLTHPNQLQDRNEPNPGKIDRIFAKAVHRRTRGRPGLIMQSRLPKQDWNGAVTAAPYSVLQGFDDLFVDFKSWLETATNARVHGRLFAPDRARFAGAENTFNGALSDNATLRDYNPRAFLTNLIWNTRGEPQCFQHGPGDTPQILEVMAYDSNARISVISGAWAVPLFQSGTGFIDIRDTAAHLQKLETKQLSLLRSQWVRAHVRIWTMADFIEAPMDMLKQIVDDVGRRPGQRLTEAPQMVDLKGFSAFLQRLKNEGMHPHLMGDFSVNQMPQGTNPSSLRPYLVKR
ncbi:MAG: beta-1,6-N-acetylglucosaminyltransferase [Rhodobacteraceae bacterium]|nr:beta-1,6-N-acetylglucosaminyltransferase [Paracoccaceae bacterium]